MINDWVRNSKKKPIQFLSNFCWLCKFLLIVLFVLFILKRNRTFMNRIDRITCNEKVIRSLDINGQAIYLYSFSLTERAETIITFHHHRTNFLSTLEMTYTQVWYIIGIVIWSPTYFHSETIGLIRSQLCQLVVQT